MQEYIRRHMIGLDLEVCEEAGLHGIVPYHSCEKGPQTFAKLTADLLQDSTMRCTWVATIGDCKPVPEDCACSRSKAASSDLTNAVLSNSNLGGLGPGSGAEEFRIQNAGASDRAEPFDIVVTALSEYKAKFPEYNGLYGF